MKEKLQIWLVAVWAEKAAAEEARPINFAEALHQRTIRALFHISQRAYTGDPSNPGAWSGLDFGEAWVGELVDDNKVVYTRKKNPAYTVVLENIQPDDIADLVLGHPVTISESDKEVRLKDLNVQAGSWSDTFTHQFAKTTSLAESHKAGFELALEITAGYTPGTATGGGKFEAKFTAKAHYEYGRTQTNTEATTDTETRTLSLGPADMPFVGHVEATRSVARISRTSTASVSFEHSIKLKRNGVTDYSWNSWGELMRVMQGLAPTNRSLAREFNENPLAQSRIDAINSFPIPTITWDTVYDGVLHQSITLVRDNVQEHRDRMAAVADEALQAALDRRKADRQKRKRERRDARRAKRNRE